jgi:hypothetical protein
MPFYSHDGDPMKRNIIKITKGLLNLSCGLEEVEGIG